MIDGTTTNHLSRLIAELKKRKVTRLGMEGSAYTEKDLDRSNSVDAFKLAFLHRTKRAGIRVEFLEDDLAEKAIHRLHARLIETRDAMYDDGLDFKTAWKHNVLDFLRDLRHKQAPLSAVLEKLTTHIEPLIINAKGQEKETLAVIVGGLGAFRTNALLSKARVKGVADIAVGSNHANDALNYPLVDVVMRETGEPSYFAFRDSSYRGNRMFFNKLKRIADREAKIHKQADSTMRRELLPVQ
jgi:hypothetical protein